jgi:hypothetical protein
LVAGRNRRFENYLCPHHQGCDVTGYPELGVSAYRRKLQCVILLNNNNNNILLVSKSKYKSDNEGTRSKVMSPDIKIKI